MPDVPQWVLEALSDVYDPCCREKGISVVDMGLVRAVHAAGGQVRVELLLTSGWCPFAAGVLTEVQERIAAQPGVTGAEVEIVWDEAWTTDRLSARAASLLRFLPPPSQVPDRAAYLAAHQPEPAAGQHSCAGARPQAGPATVHQPTEGDQR
jgi:metal-sulfur cluster biosynthetic enzyme